MENYRAFRLTDVESVPWPDGGTWHPVRAALGLRAFDAGGYSAARAGDVLIEPHTEAVEGRGHEGLYVVLAGHARFTLDGEDVDAPAGTIVFAAPHVRRGAIAVRGGTEVLALGGPPTFRALGGEWLLRARPLIPDDLGRAREILEHGRRRHPDSPGIAYGWALLLRAEGEAPETYLPFVGDAVAKDALLRGEAIADGFLHPGDASRGGEG